MSNADLLSIVINLAVGLYFALIYPKSLKKRFHDRPAPRAFALLQKVIPPVGWLIVVMTLVYAVSILLS